MLIWKLLPTKLFLQLKEKVQDLLVKEAKRKPMSHELKNQLMEEFKPSVEQLNSLLKKEHFIQNDLLDIWGYKKEHN